MRSPIRFRLFPLAGLTAALLALLALEGAALAATRTVEVGQGGQLRFFDDVSHTSTTTINVGDTVMWTWDSGFHSTTSGACGNNCLPDGNWDSGENSGPHSFTHVFNQAGSFPYHCSVHGSAMQGTVIVQPAGIAPTANFTFAPSGVPVMGTPVNFTDTSTGSPTSWTWNFGDPASGSSNIATLQSPTHTFQAAGTYNVSLLASNASGSNTATKPITVSAGGGIPCVADNETLCLNNGRFAVTADWTKPDATSGHGSGVKLTGDSGYFWFFDPANIEVVTKVLNGCAIDNAYWVFAAGLTNVKVEMKVVDTQTGIVYAKENPQGTPFAPIQDTSAFPSSCP
jgi:PKD repeat protein